MPHAEKIKTKISIDERNRLATNYLPLVRKIAKGLSCKAPSSVTVDDLFGAGLIGLMDAANRYDPEQQEQFGAFVATRVRGAMIDELRSNDPLSRDMRTKSNRVTRTIHNLQHELNRQPDEEEIAAALNLSLDVYHRLLGDLQQATFLSPVNVEQALERCSGYSQQTAADPQTNYLFAEMQAVLARAIAKLSDKEQRVLSMYYKDELSLKEIGERFNVSDSRVCQIRTQAIHRLRALVEEAHNG